MAMNNIARYIENRRVAMSGKLGIVAVLLLLASIISPVVVNAAMPSSYYVPDVTQPQVLSLDFYQNYLVSGDVLAIAKYDVRYTTGAGGLQPTASIDQTYVARLMNGAAELANDSPYPYFSSGYNNGYVSWYFPAAGAPAWLGAYSAILSGLPYVNWLGTTASTAVGSYQLWNGVAWVDDTVDMNDAGANDAALLDATPVVDDTTNFGLSNPFNKITINIGTPGAGAGWTVVWEYYNTGGSWVPLSGVTDDTTAFTAAVGNHDVTWTMPTDWEPTTLNAVGPLYYMRARVSTFTGMAVQPLATQGWLNGNSPTPTSLPFATIFWHTSPDTTTTSNVLALNVITWAEALSNQWNIALTTQTASGSILSNYGDAYFSNAIPGLRNAVPQIYLAGTNVIQPTYTPISATVPATVNNFWPWAGTVGEAGPVMKGFFFFLIGGAIILGTMFMTGRTDLGIMIVGMVWLPVGVRIGLMSMGVGFVIGIICLLVLLFTLVLNRGAT